MTYLKTHGVGKKHMSQSSKVCIICQKVFTKPSKTAHAIWATRKYCSKKCQGVGQGLEQIGVLNHRYGKKNTEQHNQSIREANTGNKSHLWKGDDVDYRSLHAWIVRWRGQPDTCEHCGDSGLAGHSIQWANIDGKYRRVLEDYIRLCAKCHWHYDRN